MFVEILLSLQPMAADGHSVISCVDDVCVVEFAHSFEFLENAIDLDIDIFTTSVLAA